MSRVTHYPAVLVGASNGALVHLAAAAGVPWLPQTLLVPVRRPGADPHAPEAALEFGLRFAPALLAANPHVALHQMHDANQDELMVSEMPYFRIKHLRLPPATGASWPSGSLREPRSSCSTTPRRGR